MNYHSFGDHPRIKIHVKYCLFSPEFGDVCKVAASFISNCVSCVNLELRVPALRNNFFLDKIPHDLLHAISINL